jgi:branched-chain amino acid aminotransferase
MTELANQRIAYFNGRYVPESQVLVPFRDRSFKYGDAAFDMTRTFGGRPFKLQEHVERFYRSLRYLRIDPGLSVAEMIAVSEEVVARNAHLRPKTGDWWIGQRVSRGVDAVGDEGWDQKGPTVIVECLPLPLKQRAPLFRDGIEMIVPSIRRTSPSALSPRAKTHNYLNVIMADLEVKSENAKAWSVLLDENGNLAEGIGSNIFLVQDGRLYTPREHYVLPGISRQTVIDLAGELGIHCEEKDLDMFDAANAEEIFLTSTSLCLCPVRSVNGQAVGTGKVPGPVTRRLTDAYGRFVDCDIVGQYLAAL